jgi:hypothetical protein
MIASHHLYKLEAILALPFRSGTRVLSISQFHQREWRRRSHQKLVGASPEVDTKL